MEFGTLRMAGACFAFVMMPMASADPFFVDVNGSVASVCALPAAKKFEVSGGSQVTQPPIVSSGTCGPLGSSTVTATGAAGDSAFYGSVTIMGTVLGFNPDGTGFVNAGYIDTVTLHPPPGFTGSGVTFGIAVPYTIDLRGPGAKAIIGLAVPSFSQNKSKSDTGFDGALGDFGLLQTGDMTFVKGPFTTEFSVGATASVSGGDGDYAEFSDPVTFILPPGWTYTLASQEATAVPEPSTLSFAIISLGLVGISVIRHRRTVLKPT